MTPTVRQALAQSGLVPVDAQVLFAHVLGCARTWLVAHDDDPLPRLQADAFFALAKRRRAGEPVAYFTGTREFWGLSLRVTPDVLIPRPETETLVELALEWLPRDGAQRVLDLGTGSGAIALAIAAERPRARGRDRRVGGGARGGARQRRAARVDERGVRARGLVRRRARRRVRPRRQRSAVRAAGDPHLSAGDLRSSRRARWRPAWTGSPRCARSSEARRRGWRAAARSPSSTATTSRRRCRSSCATPASASSPCAATWPEFRASRAAGHELPKTRVRVEFLPLCPLRGTTGGNSTLTLVSEAVDQAETRL